MSGNHEMIDLWNGDATAAWADEPDRYDVMLEPFGARVLEAAEIGPDDRVLDVGCGSGALSRAAGAIAEGGSVTGVDVSLQLLEVGRSRAAAEHLTNVTFAAGDAQCDDIPGAPFDAVISRFGVMFFADPVAAFTNLHRSARPGARLAFVAWQPVGENEWAMVPVLAVMPHLGLPDVGAPGAPGPFAFGDPDRVREILTTAGWTGVDIQPMTVDVLLYGASSPDDAAEAFWEDVLGKRLSATAEPGPLETAKAALREALAARTTAAGVRLGAAVWIVTARAG